MATINGTLGSDTLTGTASADSIFGFAGNDSLLGLGGKDSLDGGNGNDILNGGLENDTLVGGADNDTYIVERTTISVTEAANSGIDTVVSSVSYTLDSNLENLKLTATGAINGTGNELDNKITGNAANNVIDGGRGDDILYGGDGNDTLKGGSDLYDQGGSDTVYGGNGNDIVDGGRGDDILYGGDGNDTIRAGDEFNDYAPANDIVYGGNGNDILYAYNSSYKSYVFSGEDTLYGGDGNDTLVGDVASNTLDGGSGNDTYIINEIRLNNRYRKPNIIIEADNSGIDTVVSSVSYTLSSSTLENLTLQEGLPSLATVGTGNSFNNTIIGNTNSNILNGEAGNDKLDGKAGDDKLLGSSGAIGEIDTLTGGASRDTFFLGNATAVFYDDRNSTTAGTSDYALITDFNTSLDAIRLNGQQSDYRLATSPIGLPGGTAIYLNQPTGEDELIAIVQGSSSLNLNGNYFKFTANEVNLSTLNGTNGFVVNGINQLDYLGTSVSSAGDINADGFDDIIIGSSAAGLSYVVFGKSGGFDSSLNVSNLNGSNGFTIIGAITGLGRSVSSAGDVNGDGFDDIIVATLGVSSYVVFGKAENFDANLSVSSLIGSNGFEINGSGTVWQLGSGEGAGDNNGDGFDDLLIFAREKGTGSSYVVFGKAGSFGTSLNLSSLNGTNGFSFNDIATFNYLPLGSVSSAGDINGDGFEDIIIGANGADPNGQGAAGSSYVVFGKAGSFGTKLNRLNGTNGFVLDGINYGDFSGTSVSSAGDVNGDGFGDIIIGASGADPNDQDLAGSSYVVFGKAGGFDSSLNLSSLNGTNGFAINGIYTDDSSGSSVSSAGDVNGDGFDDIIIGAPGADTYGQEGAGSSYVVFGKAGGFAASLNLLDINGRNGFVINGIEEGDISGSSVSSAGDVNGDGFDDIIIGNSSAESKWQENAGKSYVIFGRDFTNSVTIAGTVGNDTLAGTASNDIILGNLGNDRLNGGTGIDVLYGSAGDDTITFSAIARRINGGSGTDTLTIAPSAITLDLTKISNNKITSFETIDITGTGDNNLVFNRLDVLALSDTTNRLIVNGNAGDAVTSTKQGWTAGGTTTVDTILYNRYTVGAATLLVDTDITQTIT